MSIQIKNFGINSNGNHRGSQKELRPTIAAKRAPGSFPFFNVRNEKPELRHSAIPVFLRS